MQVTVIAERCQGRIRALSQVKPHRSSHEIYDTDHGTHSHPLDALRYLLVNLPQPAAEWYPPDYSGQVMPRIWQAAKVLGRACAKRCRPGESTATVTDVARAIQGGSDGR